MDFFEGRHSLLLHRDAYLKPHSTDCEDRSKPHTWHTELLNSAPSDTEMKPLYLMLDLSKHLMTSVHCEVPKVDSACSISRTFLLTRFFPPEPISNIFSSEKTCNTEELTTTTTKILFPVQPHSPETNTAPILVVLVVTDINKLCDFFFFTVL